MTNSKRRYKPKVTAPKCKCLTCSYPFQAEVNGRVYLICDEEACFMNCESCSERPQYDKRRREVKEARENIDDCDDCGAKVILGKDDYFIERGTYGIPKGQQSKMVCRSCYETNYSLR